VVVFITVKLYLLTMEGKGMYYIDTQPQTNTKPIHPSDAVFTKFYDDLSRGWEEKANRLINRRWREINNRHAPA